MALTGMIEVVTYARGLTMPEEIPDPVPPTPAAPPRSKDEIALELMKFIAVSTGYGKGSGGAGYGSKVGRSSEEYADALLELFERCRTVVNR
jgi:hypothetical protein